MGREQYEAFKSKEEKRLHFIPRVHRMVGEEEFDPYQKGAPRSYVMQNSHKEEEKRKYNERRTTREIKDLAIKLNKKGDYEYQ